MTLNDIGRMLKLARVPRSKTIQHNGGGFLQCFILHVPASHYMLLANVVGKLQLPTDNVQVVPLTSDHRDVPEGKHVFYKMNAGKQDQWQYPLHTTTESEKRKYRSACRRARNALVVIDCASVALG